MGEWFWNNWQTVVDLATAAATIGAALLAWRAIEQTRRQSDRAAHALIRERRVDFELEHLDRIDERFSRRDSHPDATAIVRSLRLLPDSDLPRLRALYFPETAPTWALTELTAANRKGSGVFAYPTSSGLRLDEAAIAEIHDAIRTRLTERAAEDAMTDSLR